jgi:hypothetical protein
MDDRRVPRVPSVPEAICDLIQVNTRYSVFVCPECRKAVQPSTFTRQHLKKKHSVSKAKRREVQAYIDKVKWDYTYKTVELPKDMSPPQPGIEITVALECPSCPQSDRPVKTSSSRIMKDHWRKVHNTWLDDDEVLDMKVTVQSWFRGGGEERYWRVVEEKGVEHDGLRETPVVEPGQTVDDVVEFVDRDSAEETIVVDTGVIVISSDGSDDEMLVRKRPVITIDDDSGNKVLPRKRRAVIPSDSDDSDDEVLPRKQRAVVASDSDNSDNRVLVPIRIRAAKRAVYRRAVRTRAVTSRRLYSSDSEDTDYEPSTDNDGDSSRVESERGADGDREESSTVADNEEDEVINRTPWRARVKKPPVFVDLVGRGIDDSEDDPDPPSRRSPKRRQRSPPPFVDSGVVMPSSADDGYASDARYVPASSPPNVILVVDSESAEDDKRQPKLEVLRQRLEVWCRACPVCVLAQGGGRVFHRMEHCRREDTVELVSKTRVLQQHIQDAGGFQGKDGCRWCGVPRAICQRWQARPGRRWEEVAGQVCQYREGLTAAVVTMTKKGYGCVEGRVVATEWMRRDGVELQPEREDVELQPERVSAQVRDEVFGWYSGATTWEGIGMQVARMVWVFHMLVNKNRGVGKV